MSSDILPKAASNDDRTFALLAHLSYFVLAIFGPLILMLVKKDSPFVEDQAKEALNFHLAVVIVAVVSSVTCIGPFIVAIGAIVYAIIAALEANKGVAYRYPYTIRLIK
jgi:uncharacterized Tic20 family protein